jgi:UDP-N-acetylmuramate--alanine ligase
MDSSFFSTPRNAHLVGIAGSGMRSLADVLLGWEWTLSGSDLNVADFSCNGQSDTPFPSGKLSSGGADIPICHICGDFRGRQECLSHQSVTMFQGHAAENLPAETELVIYSNAVPPTNPELRRAAELGIATLSYFQMLGRLGLGRRTLAVAGTHGKSTATSMLAHLLLEAGLDPTVVCGATPLGARSGGRAGDSDLFLVEACEYRANFLHLRPQQAAILGIEPDHFDCYDSLGQLEDAFRRFAESIPGDGLLVARHDCQSTRRVTAGLKCRVESFGFSPDADWSANFRRAGVSPGVEDAGGTSALRVNEPRGQFRVEIRRFGRRLCEVQLPMPGEHNVLNALAAAALAYANGVSPEQISTGLESFPGLHRRLERLAPWRGVTLIDDYAHHPTEVAAALAAVRLMAPHARVWCVFQPHQASRTARLLDQLAASLQNADKVLVAEIFRAREGDPQPGEVTAADLARRAAALGADVLPGHTAGEIVETLETQLAAGDVLVTLGAGDVEKLRPAEFDARSRWTKFK